MIRAIFAVVLTCLLVSSGHAATTLLPNGEQCFQTANGPVASGSVNMYAPGTTTPKTTWQNSTQTVANNQPIQLDANGCAIIYGVGSYRQQLFTGPVVGGLTTGNLVFDLVTTDTSAFNSTFWAGVAGGTPNVITITDTGFNATDGSVINFTPIASNTGATTINPSGFGAITVEKDTSAGPTALIGGEIVCSGGICNVVSVVYRASDNAFHILNPVIQTGPTNAPLCGATGYVTQNNSGTPNTQLNTTATTAVLVTPGGVAVTRNNVSFTINAATNGANGLDTGSLGASQVYYLFMIDNGTAPAGLISLSSTAPALPGGYTFTCRLGAWITDASSHLSSLYQAGKETEWTVAVSAAFQSNNIQGNCNTPSYVATTFSLIPTTATFATGYVFVQNATKALVSRGAATGTSAGGVSLGVAGLAVDIPYIAPLTTAQTVYFCNSSNSNTVFVTGWIDAVNAQ